MDPITTVTTYDPEQDPFVLWKREVERLRNELADLDEQNIMQQDYLRQIRDASAIEYARGLAQEAIERSR